MLVIDTCSLLNLVKFYLPFDSDSILFNTIKTGVESGEFVIIDKVYKQCSYTAKGIIIDAFPFLKEHQTSTTDCLPDKRFFQFINNDFKSDFTKKISAEEFEVQKQKFLDDADVKMLLFCEKNRSLVDTPRILTDESGVNNDSKFFQKLPLLCAKMDIGVLDLPAFLKEYNGVNVLIK